MRQIHIPLVVCLPFFLSLSLSAQQTSPSGLQAQSLLKQSLAALTGGQPLTDVTLSGTARRIAGSDDESGTAVLKALASGDARIDLSLSSGQRSEVENLSGTSPAGSWSGPDAASHPIALHNLLTEPAWFFPAFAISRRLSTSGHVVTYVGQETHEGQAVEHISVSQTSPSKDPPLGPSFAHLTQVDFFLDSATLLPASISFNIHPDNDARLDLPVEIRFSDYRPVHGAEIPFHIQKLLNNSLLLDFQVQSVTPNSGLAATTFTVAASLLRHLPSQPSTAVGL
jgi:hypothetical protein